MESFYPIAPKASLTSTDTLSTKVSIHSTLNIFCYVMSSKTVLQIPLQINGVLLSSFKTWHFSLYEENSFSLVFSLGNSSAALIFKLLMWFWKFLSVYFFLDIQNFFSNFVLILMRLRLFLESERFFVRSFAWILTNSSFQLHNFGVHQVLVIFYIFFPLQANVPPNSHRLTFSWPITPPCSSHCSSARSCLKRWNSHRIFRFWKYVTSSS